MKYLLQAIESRRQCVKLSDPELTKLLTDVQRARDDRSMLVESLERLLQDLRAQSHAAAFLSRVNKRDAPDYYDVIKNPMDLSLMLKNVKSGKYRTKESFRRDLDLIWDNCLIYNSEPSHPLRVSANLMRKRSHDLLSYIQDSKDVQSALSDWVANHTNLTLAQAKALQKGDLSAINSITTPITSAASAPAGADPNSSAAIAGSSSTPPPASIVTVTDGKDGPKKMVKSEATEQDSEAFENRPALLVASGASLAETAIEERRRGERDEYALSTATGEDWGAARGASGSTHRIAQPVFEAQDEEAEVDRIISSLAEGRSASLVAGGSVWEDQDAQAASSSFRPYPSSSAQRLDVMLPKLPASHLAAPRRPSNGPSSPSKRRKAQHPASAIAGVDGERQQPKRRRATDVMRGNIATLKRMKRLKDKFDILDYCLDNEQPLPGSLLIDSDDEDDRALGRKDNKRARLNGFTHHPEAGPSNPHPRISLSHARSSLKERIALIVGNAGFEAAQTRTMDVLAGVAESFLLSLGRTIRLYVDRYGTPSPSSSMSPEQILLHVLHTTSRSSPTDLDKYITEDTMRYSSRLAELKRKLEASWKERVALGEEKLMTEEDARFFGEESEDLVAGNLPSAFEDDFFGFKAMGLDAELGMTNMSVPLRLLQRRGPAGRRGLAGDAAADRGSGEAEQTKDVYPPPPAFVPLSEAAIPAQIGLLRPFYTDLLHRRGHRKGARQGNQDGDEADGEDDEEEDEDDGMLVLSDEEQERTTRYKVPPTGKMPRRDFWRPGGTTAPAKKAAPPAPVATAAASNKGGAKGGSATAEKAGTASGGGGRGGRGGGGRGRGRKRGGKAD
ncbi:hypothetical protein BDZ90DRAFT_250353 [Jaminaea rosea]|uniref:Bromo domain-containing protein n=1 Tax=Jaminaea rosea TaxID=1569628 RepID=A0A316UUQ7_9BASI|nr:hypothetical protein BDZ90DRAFT_250353 [Jaminaea rosea]PWN29037.1 hypothetical protein BDZ90DRAFT_250353 [Jaminaea rosea]